MTMEVNQLFIAAFAAVAVLLSAYYVFLMLASRRVPAMEKNRLDDAEGISVIVVARNDLDSLRTLVPSLLAQKYPRFEIVVVNDRSFDNTDAFLRSVQRNYPTVLHIATIPSDTTYPWAGKKFAVAMGVKAAHYDRMALIDVHSVPAGEGWLGEISRGFSREKEYVLGYTSFSGGGLRMAGEFVCQADYLAWAGAGMPFRARPSNFAFRKSTFLSRNGYMKDMRVPSGEADFLLQDGAARGNTAVVISSRAMVVKTESLTSRQWKEKDMADYAAYRHYSLGAKVKTLFAPVVKTLFLASALVCGIFWWNLWEYWVAVSVPVLLSVAAGAVCARRFSCPGWMSLGILLDAVLLPWEFFKAIGAAARLPRGWK